MPKDKPLFTLRLRIYNTTATSVFALILGAIVGLAAFGVDTLRVNILEFIAARNPVHRAFPECASDSCIVKASSGGSQDVFLTAASAIKDGAQDLVIIDGPCGSACAMFADFARPHVCITSNAFFGFHKGSREVQGLLPWVRTTERFTPVHSSDIAQWVARRGGFPADDGDTIHFLDMSFEEARKFWPTCKVDNTPLPKADRLDIARRPQTAAAK